MTIQRTMPPAAAPLRWRDLWNGLIGVFRGERYLRKFEDEIKAYFEVKHVFPISSGKAALFLILRSLKSLSPEKHEVLIPAYTCFSVPSAVVKAGLKLALCEIDRSTLNLDPKLLESVIKNDTLCVVPAHLFGNPSEMNEINRIAKAKDIFVVEDAAQAMGGLYQGRKLGTLADVGFFSLGRGKNITCGSGGIIVTNSDRIASCIKESYSEIEKPAFYEVLKELLKALAMKIFIHPMLYWLPSKLSFLRLGETLFYKDFPIMRLSGVQAGILRNWRERLEESTHIHLERTALFSKELQLFRAKDGMTPYLRLPIIAETRELKEKVIGRSREQGMGISTMYPTPINEIKEIRNRLNGREFASAKFVAERLFTLPTHHFVEERDVRRISALLNEEPFGQSFGRSREPGYPRADKNG
jgi:perosamine synthetase